MNDQAGPPIVVFLVHGTQLLWWLEKAWARWQRALGYCPNGTRGLWPEKGQPFRERLTELLGPGARVYDLAWSGANRHAARMEAAHRLRDELSRHPHARRFVVAHSHGGNIARAALLAGAPERLADGLVCLSTPFFYARQRPNVEWIRGRVFAAGLVVFLGLMVSWITWSERVGMSDDAAAFTFTFGSMLLAVLTGILLQPWAKLVRSVDAHCARLETAAVGCPALLLHVAGDEAFRSLKVVEWVPAVTQYLIRVAEAVPAWWEAHPRMRRLFWIAAMTLSLGTAAGLGILALEHDRLAGTMRGGLAGVWTATGLVGVLLLAAFLLPLLALVTVRVVPAAFLAVLELPSILAKWCAFGMPSWRYEITTEAAVIGQSTIAQLPHDPKSRGAWHSQSYLHPEAAGKVAEWILGCAAAESSAGQGPPSLAEVPAAAE